MTISDLAKKLNINCFRLLLTHMHISTQTAWRCCGQFSEILHSDAVRHFSECQ